MEGWWVQGKALGVYEIAHSYQIWITAALIAQCQNNAIRFGPAAVQRSLKPNNILCKSGWKVSFGSHRFYLSHLDLIDFICLIWISKILSWTVWVLFFCSLRLPCHLLTTNPKGTISWTTNIVSKLQLVRSCAYPVGGALPAHGWQGHLSLKKCSKKWVCHQNKNQGMTSVRFWPFLMVAAVNSKALMNSLPNLANCGWKNQLKSSWWLLMLYAVGFEGEKNLKAKWFAQIPFTPGHRWHPCISK